MEKKRKKVTQSLAIINIVTVLIGVLHAVAMLYIMPTALRIFVDY